MKSEYFLIFLLAGILALSAPQTAWAGASYAYVDSRLILTVELSTAQRATVNFFNLTDYVVAFKAQDLLLIAQGNFLHLGQVIVRETPQRDEGPYAGSTLIKPWTYEGLTILGAFPEPDQMDQVIVLLGGKRLSLVRQEPAEFDELAGRIESLDMKKRDGPQIIDAAGIGRRGKIQYPSGEQDELDLSLRKILGADDINPPRIQARTKVQLTEAALNAGVKGRIRMSISLTRYGEIKEVKVIRGLGYGMDERAVEVVKNSWKFLPATKNSEVVDVTMTIEVEITDNKAVSRFQHTKRDLALCHEIISLLS